MISRRVFFVAGLAAAGMASILSAELIGIAGELGFPALVFNTQGDTVYDADVDLLSVDALPLAIRFFSGGPIRLVTTTGTPPSEGMSIRVEVDDTGALIGGVPGDDLIVEGEVDEDGDGVADFSGILLTGEVVEFGFEDSGGSTDLFDFRFDLTGGELASFYAGPHVGVTLTSENSNFHGDFTRDFDGDAKGNIAGVGGQGCTPGFWKQPHHLDAWMVYSPDDLFDDVFGVDATGDLTLLETLKQGGGGENAFGRHAVAALLNAASTDVDYFYAIAGVIAMVQDAYATGDFEPTKNLFEGENESGCPVSINTKNDKKRGR